MKIISPGLALVTSLLLPALAVAQPGPTPAPPPTSAPPPAAREAPTPRATRPSPAATTRLTAQEPGSAVRPIAPPPPATPPPVARAPQPAKPVDATPVGGFPLRKRRLGFLLELGYPFLDFRAGYGLTDRVQILLGYRGLYSMSSAGYAGLKLGLYQNKTRTVGLSLIALGGYTYVKGGSDYDNIAQQLVGGSGGFGEAWMMVTARRRRHGLMLVAGLRISQVTGCSDSYNCYDSIFESGRPGTLVTGFFELGWEMRFMRYASYYVALGVDMFTNSIGLPAMVRFRNGVMLDF